MPRKTRRTTARSVVGKENIINVTPLSTKKARHRLSTTELARLEDVFSQQTHPSRQQKKDLATQLGMDYKTVTIWFQNKRQTSKRGQLSVERLDNNTLTRARVDSCLRTVSSPSHNATLGASEVGLMTSALKDKGSSVAAKAMAKVKPLFDSLNVLTSRPGDHATETRDKEKAVKEDGISAGLSRHDQAAEQEQADENSSKAVTWKRVRTLEWACERQAKRRKLSREGSVRAGSAEIQDGDPGDPHMDSALSLLSLASSTQVAPPKDVMTGVSLLLSFKHSWHRKQHD